MRADILIVGQGLAGTLLAWEFERAGIPFAVVDGGHSTASSRVAAGIINPITGRRLVKSWRVDQLLPVARAAFRELEAALGVPLWQEMRVRRLFADDRERRVLADKNARGEFGSFVGAVDHDGFWIEGAARVDLPALLTTARERWRAQGRLRAVECDAGASIGSHELVIDCTGVSGARGGKFSFVPWEYSKGEVLTLAVNGLAPDVIVNGGHWVLPIGPGVAWVGATHQPGVRDVGPTADGRAVLEQSARMLLPGRNVTVTGQMAGVRVNLPDKRPVVGRHPTNVRLGVFNGLGAKGALLAPALARQWVNHLTEGMPFDVEVGVERFWARSSAQASSH